MAGPRPGGVVAPPRPADTDVPLDRLAGGMPAVRVGVAVDAPSVRVETQGRVELAEEPKTGSGSTALRARSTCGTRWWSGPSADGSG